MKIHIIEPFWGAYKFYGWGERIPGIGIAEKVVMDSLRNKEQIIVTIGKDPSHYEISPVTVVNLAKKYNSIKQVRHGIKVAVIPQNKLKKINE